MAFDRIEDNDVWFTLMGFVRLVQAYGSILIMQGNHDMAFTNFGELNLPQILAGVACARDMSDFLGPIEGTVFLNFTTEVFGYEADQGSHAKYDVILLT